MSDTGKTGEETGPPWADDPYQLEGYQRFVESMAKHCRCTPEGNRPCDGVLAGGVCDSLHRDGTADFEDEYEGDE